ncbi:Glucose and ribitol dehydrogenase [Nymphaea thermarum]|nr:Glucose and ribitol dehydrogenase [Nymphaea thermarum]
MLTNALLPLLRTSPYMARIIMVSSVAGLLYVGLRMKRQLLEEEDLTEKKIDGVLNLFLEELKSEKGTEKWPLKLPAYSTSKAAMNAYTRLLASKLNGIACVNSVHPGVVRTALTDYNGNLSAAEGAENIEAKGSEWWSGETVAVVTGANRGIGLEICRQLADKGLTVIMTARKPQEQLSSSAKQFLQEAAELGRKNVIFHTLDIGQEQSVLDFVDWLKLHIGNIDILVLLTVLNLVLQGTPNCGGGTSESHELAKECIDTNYYGTKMLTNALLPLLRPSPYKARIIMVSSVAGLLYYLRDEELRKKLSEVEDLTEQKTDGEAKGSEWWSGETVAVVTGANRGIGLEICRQLADKGLTVIMTARKPQEQLSSSAKQFLQEAAELGRKNVIFHTLDIGLEQSVLDFVDWLKLHVGNIDILYLRDEELRKKLSEVEDLTEQKTDGVLNLFLEDLKSEKGKEKWPCKLPAYSTSKAAMNAYTRLLASKLKGIACVNSVHPGVVRTALSNYNGNLSAAEGAENIVRVALFPVGGPSGHNFLEREDSEF